MPQRTWDLRASTNRQASTGFGTIDGYAAEAESRADQLRVNVNDWEEVFCLRLIQGDIDGALTAAEFVRDTGHADGRGFVLAAAERVTNVADTSRQNAAHALAISPRPRRRDAQLPQNHPAMTNGASA